MAPCGAVWVAIRLMWRETELNRYEPMNSMNPSDPRGEMSLHTLQYPPRAEKQNLHSHHRRDVPAL